MAHTHVFEIYKKYFSGEEAGQVLTRAYSMPMSPSAKLWFTNEVKQRDSNARLQGNFDECGFHYVSAKHGCEFHFREIFPEGKIE